MEQHLQDFIGAGFVRYVVDALGVQRIKHGIRPIKDPAVLELLCAISADDPICFGNDIEDEYFFLANQLGFTTAELDRVASNGFDVALVDDGRKREILREVVDVVGGI